MERYVKNMPALSLAENQLISKKRVCITGCGGLGGFVMEILARIGVGHLTLIDGDIFVESNLNRQLLADMDSLGRNKASQGKERLKKVNPLISVIAYDLMLTEANAKEILADHDVVVDALDNLPTRKLLQKNCEELNLPLVHGAIGGWFGQATTIFPGDGTFDLLYPADKGVVTQLGNPAFLPPLIAAVEAGEVLKILLGRGEGLRKKLFHVDLLKNDFTVIDLC